MEIPKQAFEIKVTITEVANKCLRHVKRTTEVVTLLHHLLEKYDDSEVSFLPVDGLPIFLKDEETKDETPTKNLAKDWILKKAFEEFIFGISESLIEMHIFLDLFAFSKESEVNSFTESELKDRIDRIKKAPTKKHFPNLMSDIEKKLGCQLPLTDEISSINKVRTCLVHRNGIVTDQDVNDKENEILNLKVLELVIIAAQGDRLFEIKHEHKNVGVLIDGIGANTRSKTISFKNGEYLMIDSKTFNNISFTCIVFVTNLLELLPIPKR